MTDFGNRKFVAACKQEGLNPIQEFVFGEILGVKFRSDFYFECGNKELALEVEFQFLSVRLKVEANSWDNVHILGFQFLSVRLKERFVPRCRRSNCISIPFGAIKSKNQLMVDNLLTKFQFLSVRLKVKIHLRQDKH